MNNEQLQLDENDQQGNFDSLKLFLSRCLYHWPLFLIGVLLTISFTIYKLKTTKPTYVATSRILVNVGKGSGESSALQKLNVTDDSRGVENEIEIIKSRQVISNAVNDLNLWVSYQETGKYYEKDIYANTPVKFQLLNNKPIYKNQTFEIIVLANRRFVLIKSDGSYLNASFDNILKNSFGEWKLKTTENLNNYIGKKITITITNPNDVASNYQSSINISSAKEGSNMLSLSITDQVPERGREFLNALIKNYIAATKENKNQSTANALKFLNTRIASIAQELNNTEKKAAGFKSNNKFTDISVKGNGYLGNVQSNDLKLSDINIQLDLLNGIEDYVNSSRNSDNAPVTTGITDPSLNGLVGQLSVAIQQRNKLLATVPETNPVFEPINKQIKSIKDAIKEAIRGIRSSLLITKRQIDLNNSRFESSFKDVPGQEREYGNITRQKSLKEDQYLYLSQQRETIALNYASTLSDVQVIDEPHDLGMSPSKAPVFLTTAFLLGLILPAGLVYGRTAIKNHITNKREIEANTNVPVVTEVNYEEDISFNAILNRSGNLLGEQIRELRTKLLYIHQKKSKGRVTLLTSSTSGEGKSFITSNLGVAIASSGRKTIVIELDLRKPKISKIYGLSEQHLGLSNYLSGEISNLKEIIQPSPIRQDLYVIGAGSIPDNPSELLENFRMEELISILRTEYDDILLDTPPIHLVTDAMIVSELSDATLYIVRQGYTSKEELDFIKRIAKEKRLPRLNIVFNGIENKKYGNSYHYDNSYYAKQIKSKSVKSILKNLLSRF